MSFNINYGKYKYLFSWLKFSNWLQYDVIIKSLYIYVLTINNESIIIKYITYILYAYV